MRKLTSAQQTVFKLYKGNSPFLDQQCFADFLNMSLGCKHTLPHGWEAQAIELDALIRASSLPSVKWLYRAMPEGYLAPHVEASYLRYPAYMSTTVDKHAVQRHFATPFRDIPAALLCIECDAGTPALDMELDESFGGMEQELLLPRGSTFSIEGIEDVTDLGRMSTLMSPLYAKSYSMLKIYRLKYVR